MALSINTNSSALFAIVAASSSNRETETSLERLSSGTRLNSASDDAAGIAIASRLTADVRGTNLLHLAPAVNRQPGFRREAS